MKNNLKENSKDTYRKYNELHLERFITKDDIKINKRKRAITFISVAAVFVLNAVFNVISFNGILANFYMAIILSFIICVYSLSFYKEFVISDIIASIALVFGIGYLGFNGWLIDTNVIWVLVIPFLWFYIVDYRVALVTNILLLVIFCIIFLTSFNQMYIDIYSLEFMYRFPFLFLLIMIISILIFRRFNTNEIKSKLLTYNDEVTSLSNRAYYKMFVNFVRKKGLTNIEMIVVSLDVNSLKRVNDTLGHEYGDILISAAAKMIKKSFPNAEIVSRIGGDEFIVITYEDYESFMKCYNSLDENCKEFKNPKIEKLTISKGYARSKDHPYINPEKLYIIADREMYKNKSEYYKKEGIDRRVN